MADVSQRLLTKLEEALNGKDFDQQVIGELSCELHHENTSLWGFPQGLTQTRQRFEISDLGSRGCGGMEGAAPLFSHMQKNKIYDIAQVMHQVNKPVQWTASCYGCKIYSF